MPTWFHLQVFVEPAYLIHIDSLNASCVDSVSTHLCSSPILTYSMAMWLWVKTFVPQWPPIFSQKDCRRVAFPSPSPNKVPNKFTHSHIAISRQRTKTQPSPNVHWRFEVVAHTWELELACFALESNIDKRDGRSKPQTDMRKNCQ